MAAEEEVSRKPFDSGLFLRLLAQARPYWLAVTASTIFLLLNALLQAGIPLLSKIAVDRYLAPSPTSTLPLLENLLPATPADGLMAIAAIYFAVIAFSLGLQFSQQLLMQWTGQRIMFDLRRRIYGHLQRLDISYFDTHPVGRIVTRVTTDVDALNELFASGLVALMGDSLVLVFIFVTMFQLSPSLALILAGVLPLVFLATVVFRRTVQSANRKIRIALARINSYLQEHVNGITVLQLFNRERSAISSRSFNMESGSSARFRTSARNTTFCNRRWPPQSGSSSCWMNQSESRGRKARSRCRPAARRWSLKASGSPTGARIG